MFEFIAGSLSAALLIYVAHLDAGLTSRDFVATGVSTFRFAPTQRGSFEQTTTVTDADREGRVNFHVFEIVRHVECGSRFRADRKGLPFVDEPADDALRAE